VSLKWRIEGGIEEMSGKVGGIWKGSERERKRERSAAALVSLCTITTTSNKTIPSHKFVWFDILQSFFLSFFLFLAPRYT
jgi:hypothetical protein